MKAVTVNGQVLMWAPLGAGTNPYGYTKDYAYTCEWFRQFILPGDCVVDIGAYAGDYTIPFAMLTGKAGLVIACEPHPATYKTLLENAALNPDFAPIVCHNFAVMEKDGDYTFHYGANSFHNGGFASGLEVPVGKQKVAHVVPVPVIGRRLQDYLPERPLNFVKIDTEGWDHHVLASMADIIKRDRPVIMAEVFTDLTVNERMQFRDVVASLGYFVGHREGPQAPDIEHFTGDVAFDVILYPSCEIKSTTP